MIRSYNAASATRTKSTDSSHSNREHDSEQQRFESTPDSSTSPIEEVTDNDVLCGRGGHANKHPGNHLFRRVVNENKDLYQSYCGQRETHKHVLAISIVDAVGLRGGRFLRRDDKFGKWVTISRKDAFSKTSQALREQQDGRSKKSSDMEAVESRLLKKSKSNVHDRNINRVAQKVEMRQLVNQHLLMSRISNNPPRRVSSIKERTVISVEEVQHMAMIVWTLC
jgi:hypothetical protein